MKTPQCLILCLFKIFFKLKKQTKKQGLRLKKEDILSDKGGLGLLAKLLFCVSQSSGGLGKTLKVVLTQIFLSFGQITVRLLWSNSLIL